MKDWDLTKVVLGILTVISISLGSFALMWVFNANSKIDVMQTTMTLKFEELDKSLKLRFEEFEKTHEGLADDTTEMIRITKQLSKHWKLHSWAKDQISELRHQQQLPPVFWPDLD